MTTPAHALSFSILLAAVTPAAVASDEGPVRAALILDRPLVKPGDTSTLGVTFDIAPGWNLYWQNPGESGAAPTVTLTLPPGVESGPIQWPRPTRKVLPGDILDYIYTTRVTLLVPLKATEEYDPALRAAAEAKLWWLMCDDQRCVPGEGQAVTALTGPAATGEAASRLAEARAGLPMQPAGSAGGDGGVSLRWEGSVLVITAAGATGMTFFPLPETQTNPTPPKILQQGVAAGGVMRLDFSDVPLSGSTKIEGNLLVCGASDSEVFLAVVAPPPPISAAEREKK